MYNCIVPGCKMYSGCKPKIHFHAFPFCNQFRLEEWTRALRRKNWAASKYSRVCSEHFTQNDYIAPGYVKLKSSAVPNQLLPVSCFHDGFQVKSRSIFNKFPIIAETTSQFNKYNTESVTTVKTFAESLTSEGTQTIPSKICTVVDRKSNLILLKKKIHTLQRTVQRRKKTIHDLSLTLKKLEEPSNAVPNFIIVVGKIP